MPEIRKCLVISTTHITPETAEELEHGHRGDVSYDSWASFGWWVWCDEAASEPLTEDLRAVFAFARTWGCAYVLLDRDADPVEELPRYEW